MESYYYNQLGKSGQAAYHAMLTGLRAIAPAFPVPRLEPGQLSEIFLKLRLDHPEIFYAVRFTYRYYPQASSVEMVPEYLFEKSKIQEHQKAMAARIQKLTRPAMNLSEREKEQFVHDFICRNVRDRFCIFRCILFNYFQKFVKSLQLSSLSVSLLRLLNTTKWC